MEISFESYVILEKFTRVWWFYDPEQLTNIVGSWSLAVPYWGSTCEATWKCWKRKETRGELRVLGQNINIALVPWLIAIRKAWIYMVGSILARSLCDIIRWRRTEETSKSVSRFFGGFSRVSWEKTIPRFKLFPWRLAADKMSFTWCSNKNTTIPT